MYTYKDFVTGKTKKTFGKFGGFTNPTGPLDIKYAIFKNRCSDLFVPIYCLTAETMNSIKKQKGGKL